MFPKGGLSADTDLCWLSMNLWAASCDPSRDMWQGSLSSLHLSLPAYGNRDAAIDWATKHGETLKAAGCVQGKMSLCLFFHMSKNVTVMVQGDDFVAVGGPAHLESTKAALSNK